MTENDAKGLKVALFGGGRNAGKTIKSQLDLLKELEEYRAIGTVEEFKALKENSFFNFDSPVVRVDEKAITKLLMNLQKH